LVKLSEDKLELLISGSLIVTLGFLALNFDLTISGILTIMILFSAFMFIVLPARITHNSKTNNTVPALFWAVGALVVLLISSLLLTTLFQGLLSVTAEPTLNSILDSGFSTLGTEKVIPQSTQPIFAKSAFLTILTFGVVIAAIETRFIGRMMEWLSKIANIRLDKLSLPVISVMVIISVIFVWYHFTAKGVTNNVSLLITFIFAMISLELIRRHRELESATYLHIINNMLYIVPRVQAQTGG
jgi:hypothetical protein